MRNQAGTVFVPLDDGGDDEDDDEPDLICLVWTEPQPSLVRTI